MAIYGVSFYGLDKYGLPQYVDYSVAPFVSEAKNYSSVELTWTSPSGDWTEFRLLRNWYGFPSSEVDGEILGSYTSAVASYSDRTVKPGLWHYYALWVKAGSGQWQQSATTCTLMLQEQGYSDRLFNSLPQYHRILTGFNDNDPETENADLRSFLQVLAVGFNYVKTYYDSLQYLNDPMRNRVGQLIKLASQLGIDYIPVAPPAQFRKRVANAGTLAREKGTLEATRSLIAMMTGWDVNLIMGPNMMLSEDQASFVHPQYEDWDQGINYPTGSRINYNGFIYQTNTGGAYGVSQAPSGTSANNTWWTALVNYVDTTLKNPDGSFAGWAPVSFTSGVAPPTDQVAVGVGVQSPMDPTVLSNNALIVRNPSAATADLGVRSSGGNLSDPEVAIRTGIPVPVGVTWDATTIYQVGDVVVYQSLSYVALAVTQKVAPAGVSSTLWGLLSPVDNRKTLTTSINVKGVDTASRALLAYPVVDMFDDHGALIATIDTAVNNLTNNTFDSLYTGGGSLANRTTGSGGKVWTVNSGVWTVSPQKGVYALGPGMATLTGTATGSVGATFTKLSAGMASQAVVFRGTSSTVYLRASRTNLSTVNGSAVVSLGTYSSAFADGDRITVDFSGNNLTVRKNGVPVLSVVSSFNATGTIHGILVT